MSYQPGPADVPPPPPPQSLPPARPWLPWAVAAAGVIAVAAVFTAVLVGVGGEPTATSRPQAVTTSEGTTPTSSTTSAPTSSTTTTTVPLPQEGGSWTVLVYGLGDNNLEGALLEDMEEMAALPDAENLTIVVLADRTPDYTDASLPGIGDWDTAKLIEVRPGRYLEQEDLGELNMGDPAVLADFVARGLAAHPADHYALILWNHGSIAGVGADDSHGDGLAIPEIAAGAGEGLARAGVDRLDVIGFDACLMSAYEVAAMVAPHARYMIASEEYEPNEGWDYSAFSYLAEDPTGSTVLGLGRAIVDTYVATSAPTEPTVTLSMLDLTRVGDLTAALADLNEVLAPNIEDHASTIGRQRSHSLSFGSSPNPEEDFFMVDLGVLLSGLSDDDSPLGAAAGTALAALEEMVVANLAGRGAADATGLSVYFPPYPEYYPAGFYEGMGVPEWPRFLDTYYQAGQGIPQEEQPSFEPVANQASYYFDGYGLNVEAAFDDSAVENIVEAVLYSGVVGEDGTVTFMGEDQGFVEGDQAYASYDLTVLILDDGEDQATAYQDISFNEDLTLFVLDVPLAYYPPGSTDYQDIVLHLTYDTVTEEFTEGFYLLNEFGTVGQFETDPTGLIVPWVLEWRPDGTLEWVQTSDVGLWADLPNLLYDFQTLEPGTPLYAELLVFDYGGNWDYAYLEAEVPTSGSLAACSNDFWGYQVSYPGDWAVWPSPDPALECAYIDPLPMEGLTADQAFDQAVLTAEVAAGGDLAAVVDYFSSTAALVEEAQVAGRTATVYQSAFGVFGYRAYLVPFGPGAESPVLVLTTWGIVDQSLVDFATATAADLVVFG